MEKVLIVEDESRMRNIIFDYFSAHGLDSVFPSPPILQNRSF